MSRNRRRRGPPQPGFQPNAQPATPSAYRIDRSKMTAGDVMLFLEGQQIKEDDTAAVGAYLAKLLPALDRLVVGGIAHVPIDQVMTRVVPEVSKALSEMGNQKNSPRP